MNAFGSRVYILVRLLGGKVKNIGDKKRGNVLYQEVPSIMVVLTASSSAKCSMNGQEIVVRLGQRMNVCMDLDAVGAAQRDKHSR